MNREPLDLRRSLQILRRRLITVGIAAALGAVAGAAYTVLSPPMHAATALVVLPSTTSNAGAQVLIAESNPVLEGALPGIKPAMSLLALNNDIQVTAVTTNLLSITAQAGTVTQAEEMANALADSYVAYADSSQAPKGQAPAKVIAACDERHGDAAARSPAHHRISRCPAGGADRSHRGAGHRPLRPATTGA